MREAFSQALDNLRANKLRSFLTMFGILWGIIAVVVLAATGEGFQRGNQTVLEELGKNIAIVWGGRTTLQAGGERAGRRDVPHPRRRPGHRAESPLVAVVSPEINRGRLQSRAASTPPRSACTASSRSTRPSAPSTSSAAAASAARRRAGAPRRDHRRRRLGPAVRRPRAGLEQTVELNGVPYTVIGRIRKKDQDSNYSGPDNDKVFVPFAAMARDFPARRRAARRGVADHRRAEAVRRRRASQRVLDARTGRIEDIDWPLERDVRRVLARRKDFDAEDRDALSVWDTSLETLMFGRMIGTMQQFFSIVGFITLALGGLGRDEHHAGGGARADPRDRRPQGARRDDPRGAAAVLPRGLLPHHDQRLGRLRAGRSGCARWSTCCRCRSGSRAW